MAQSAEIARAAGIATIIVPSHNCNATDFEIVRDDLIKWAKENKPDVDAVFDFTEELGREYLAASGKLKPEFARTAEYDGEDLHQTPKGFVYRFKTAPREKHRCIRPLADTLMVVRYLTGSTTHAQVMKAYSEAYVAALTGLGGTFDKSCSDLCRFYYEPSRPDDYEGTFPSPVYVDGKGFDFEPFMRAALDNPAKPKSQPKTKTSARSERVDEAPSDADADDFGNLPPGACWRTQPSTLRQCQRASTLCSRRAAMVDT